MCTAVKYTMAFKAVFFIYFITFFTGFKCALGASVEADVDEEAVKEHMNRVTEDMNAGAPERLHMSIFTVMSFPQSVQSGEKIKFSFPAINNADLYNLTNGVFTAPRDGSYVFHLVVETAEDTDNVQVCLLVNGRKLTILRPKNVDGNRSSVGHLVSLKANDEVELVVGCDRSRQNPRVLRYKSAAYTGYYYE